MWSRSEVKQKGKSNFKKNYWRAVLVAIIYNLFFVASTTATRSSSGDQDMSELFGSPDAVKIALAILAAASVVLIIIKIIDIFLLNPLEVGCNGFFLSNQDDNATLGELFCAYKNNYGKAVLGIFLRDLLIAIGFALFIIPGVILTYSYRMVPYILAEDPSVSGSDALKQSRMMMKGMGYYSSKYCLINY